MSQVLNFTEEFNNMTRREQLLYIAGVFDGEGCIGLYNCRTKGERRAANYQLVMRMQQKTPYGVMAMKTIWPEGRIYTLADVGPTKPGPYFAFRLVTKKAEHAIEELMPFLREKREQAILALEFCKIRRDQNVVSKREQRKMTAVELDVRDAYIEKIRMEKTRSFDVNYFQGVQ